MSLPICGPQSKEAQKLAQRIALAEEQFDQGLRKLTAASKQLASLKRQVRCLLPLHLAKHLEQLDEMGFFHINTSYSLFINYL